MPKTLTKIVKTKKMATYQYARITSLPDDFGEEYGPIIGQVVRVKQVDEISYSIETGPLKKLLPQNLINAIEYLSRENLRILVGQELVNHLRSSFGNF